MDRMIYLAAGAARGLEQAQALAAHNLANASTSGFKAELMAGTSRLLAGPGLPTRVFATPLALGPDLRQGPVRDTGAPLDVAIAGPGFLAVQAPDGGEAYTRAGELHLTADGLLVTAAGHPVLGDGGPITLPANTSASIGRDGTVSVVAPGQGPETVTVIDRLRLVAPPAGDMVRAGDGLLRPADGAELPAAAQVALLTGAIEGSNVGAVDAMVAMISHARQYELEIKLMHTAEQADAASAQLLRLSV